MSVRVSERSESKLEVQVRAEELVSHTVHIVSNPKVFDPKYTRFHDRIVDCAVSVGQCLLGRARGAQGPQPRHRADEIGWMRQMRRRQKWHWT